MSSNRPNPPKRPRTTRETTQTTDTSLSINNEDAFLQTYGGFTQSVGSSMPTLDLFLTNEDPTLLPVDMLQGLDNSRYQTQGSFTNLTQRPAQQVITTSTPRTTQGHQNGVQIVHTSTARPGVLPSRLQRQQMQRNQSVGATQVTPANVRPAPTPTPVSISIPTPLPTVITIPAAGYTAPQPVRSANMQPTGGILRASNPPTAPASAAMKIDSQVATATNLGVGVQSLPTYHASFTGLTTAHSHIRFQVPKYFYDNYQPLGRSILLVQFNSRALAIEIDATIFSSFVCRFVQHAFESKWIPFIMDIQYASPSWIARYKRANVVNNTNYDQMGRKVAQALNHGLPPRENDTLPESVDVHITARKGHLAIMLAATFTDSTEGNNEVKDTRKTMHTQTEMFTLPAYYVNMLNEQIENISTREMEVHQSFLTQQEEVKRMDEVQQGILDQFEALNERLAKLNIARALEVGVEEEVEHGKSSLGKAAQTEENYFCQFPYNPPMMDGGFAIFEENLQKLINYGLTPIKNSLDVVQKLQDENKQLKTEKSDIVRNEKDKDKDKENSYRSKDRDPRRRSVRAKDEKKSSSTKEKEKRSDTKVRSSSSKKSGTTSSTSRKNEDLISAVKYLDGIKSIIDGHNIVNNAPAKQEIKTEIVPQRPNIPTIDLDNMTLEDFKDNNFMCYFSQYFAQQNTKTEIKDELPDFTQNPDFNVFPGDEYFNNY